jgi:CRP-like cAMP-binding protein
MNITRGARRVTGLGVADPNNVSLVRTVCTTNYFATLRDYSGAATALNSVAKGNLSAREAVSSPRGNKRSGGAGPSTTHAVAGGSFTDAPSSILPANKLRELCLRTIASQRTGNDSSIPFYHGGSEALHQQKIGRTRRELRRKLRAGVSAVVFSNLLVHLRLKSIAKNLESHVCEPYRVVAVSQDLEDVCGRAVCVFAAMQQASDELLFFALDHAPLPTEGWEWRILPVMKSDVRIVATQFGDAPDEGSSSAQQLQDGCIRLCDVVVISEYDEHQRLLVPVSVEHMRGQTNTYYQIIRDFEQSVNRVTMASVLEGLAEPYVAFPTAAMGSHHNITTNTTASLDGSAQSSPTRGGGSPALKSSSLARLPVSSQPPFDAIGSGLDIPLPSYQEMQAMPTNVREAVQQLAFGVMRRCFLPRLLLRLRKKQRFRMSRGATAYPISVEQLLKLQTFEMWPPSLLDELIQSLKPYTADRGELVLQEGEVPCNAIYFLTSGTVSQIQKVDRSVKRTNAHNTKVLQPTISSLCCFGQLSFISADPRMTSVRTNSLCTFWRLFRTDYFSIFTKLPVSVRMHVQDLAFKRRTQSVPYNDPLTLPLLRSMSVFSTCGEAALKALMTLFRPMSVPPGHVLSTADGDGTAMYMLLRGRCGVFRVLRERREEAHVQSIAPPVMIGDDAVVGGGSHVTTVRTLTSADLYAITKEDFESCMSRYGADWNVVVDQATKARQLRLLDSQDRFKEMAVNIPIVASILSFPRRQELSRLFKPILYHPKQTVCCSAHFADRVIIVVEGTVRFQNGGSWECGEAAGFTCLVPHRWAQTATAVTSSKLIELRYEEYRDFLDKHGNLDAVRSAVQALMFPKAAPPETVYWALLATQKLMNPPLYPVSFSERITPCEERFGVKVVSFGQQKVHRRIATQPTTALELEVEESLRRIDDQMKKRQLARGVVQSSALANRSSSSASLRSTAPNSLTSLTTSYANASSASGTEGITSRPGSSAATRSYSKSGLLLMKAKCEANEVKGVRSVDHHPIMKEYRENYRRPTGFKRSSFHALFEDHSGINMTSATVGVSGIESFSNSVKM